MVTAKWGGLTPKIPIIAKNNPKIQAKPEITIPFLIFKTSNENKRKKGLLSNNPW